MFMTYSVKYDADTLDEFIDYFGIENIPNPEQYPIRFKFLVKTFEHYKTMKELDNDAN